MNAVLVTGASTGIGYATASLLARNGYRVFAGVRKESDRERLAAHPQIVPLILDVTVSADVSRAIESIRASGEALVGLINNAGIAIGGPLEYLPMEELRRQFEINVFAPVALAQAALPLLRESHGRIVFVGSISGRLSAPFVGPYSASKAALASLVDALRQELAPSGVAISLLEFAAVKTPIWSKGLESKERLVAALPPEAFAHYGSVLDAIDKRIRHEEQSGMDPGVIAQTILGALRVPRPRERYVIGTQAKVQCFAAVLPPRTRDRLVRKAMKLPT